MKVNNSDVEKNNNLIELFKSERGDALGWSLIFLWGALVVLIETTADVDSVSWWDSWAVFFVGFGAIVVLSAVVAIQVQNIDKAGWNFVIGFILLGFGFGGLVSTGLGWVFVLSGISIALVFGAVMVNNGSEKTVQNNTEVN